jgi:HEAT repeat protein
MGRYRSVERRTGFGVPDENVRHDPEAVTHLLALSHDSDPRARRVAVKNLCPCHIRADVPAVWPRLFMLSSDPDPGVRADVVHALTDGSPRRLETQVVAALEAMRHDPDRTVRRQVNRALSHRTSRGGVNVV